MHYHLLHMSVDTGLEGILAEHLATQLGKWAQRNDLSEVAELLGNECPVTNLPAQCSFIILGQHCAITRPGDQLSLHGQNYKKTHHLNHGQP